MCVRACVRDTIALNQTECLEAANPEGDGNKRTFYFRPVHPHHERHAWAQILAPAASTSLAFCKSVNIAARDACRGHTGAAQEVQRIGSLTSDGPLRFVSSSLAAVRLHAGKSKGDSK